MSSQFETVQHLEQWLASLGIPVEAYGKGSAKTLSQLWRECDCGESSLELEGQTPVRHVRVVTVLIQDQHARVLHEIGQTATDGRRRLRNMPLSEKMLPDEGVVEAATRGIREELQGVLASDAGVDVDVASVKAESTRQVSHSYPGLLSEYNLYQVSVKVEGLPQGSFVTTEMQGDVGLQHEWDWLPLDDTSK